MQHRRPGIFEWVMAYVLLVVGVHILFMPGAVAVSHMRLLLNLISAPTVGMICLCLGLARLAVMTIMASARLAMQLRAFCALTAAVIWFEMVYDFAQRVYLEQTLPPPGLDMLAAQGVGEIWLFYELLRRI